MKVILLFVLVLYSCDINPSELKESQISQTNTKDSLRVNSNVALILFHHQIQKKSLIAQQISDRGTLDSLLSFIDTVIAAGPCFEAGRYNSLGEIRLFADSSRHTQIATLHFVLDGHCKGLYVKKGDKINRYALTETGRRYLVNLYDSNKRQLLK